MSRIVDLVAYLPEFLAEYTEIREALRAEDPEFNLLWRNSDRALNNLYISTADEYGLEKYERLLHIVPEETDSLELRRARVQARWLDKLPYTIRALIIKLTEFCGDAGVTVYPEFEDGYSLHIVTGLDDIDMLREMAAIINAVIPVNIYVRELEVEDLAEFKSYAYCFSGGTEIRDGAEARVRDDFYSAGATGYGLSRGYGSELREYGTAEVGRSIYEAAARAHALAAAFGMEVNESAIAKEVS